jgi:hypothetical protein
LSDINNNSNDNDDNRDSDSENDSRPLVKSWVIEWHGTFGKTSSAEKDNYTEALNIFNEKTTDGKDAILYELQKSTSDATVLKKTPILNSSKAKERRTKKGSNNTNRQQKAEKRKDSKFSSLKLRIIILLSVIGALVVVLSLINALANRGGVIVNPHVVVGIATTNAAEVTINNMMMMDFLLLLQET